MDRWRKERAQVNCEDDTDVVEADESVFEEVGRLIGASCVATDVPRLGQSRGTHGSASHGRDVAAVAQRGALLGETHGVPRPVVLSFGRVQVPHRDGGRRPGVSHV